MVSGISSGAIPSPSSVTDIRLTQPFLIVMVIWVGLASSAFSRSSLTIEAGRSMISPAFNLFMRYCGSFCIGMIVWSDKDSCGV